MIDYLEFIAIVFVTLTVVPYLTALVVSFLGHLSKSILVDNLGYNSQLVVGGLGVVIHELGHAIFALIFGHKLTNVQLLNIHYNSTGTLGSVNHSWNPRNIYQRLGNFFIGLAPYYMCSLVLLLLQKFLLKTQFDIGQLTSQINLNSSISINNILEVVFNNVRSLFSNASLMMIILYLVLTVMIASTGYDLSEQDMKNVQGGVLYWLIVQFIFGTVFYLLNMKLLFMSAMLYVGTFSIVFMIHAFIYILISILVVKVLGIFNIFR